jgi:hypothetical protein
MLKKTAFEDLPLELLDQLRKKWGVKPLYTVKELGPAPRGMGVGGVSRIYHYVHTGELELIKLGTNSRITGNSVALLLERQSRTERKLDRSPNPHARALADVSLPAPRAPQRQAHKSTPRLADGILRAPHLPDLQARTRTPPPGKARPSYINPPSDFKTWVTEDEEIG